MIPYRILTLVLTATAFVSSAPPAAAQTQSSAVPAAATALDSILRAAYRPEDPGAAAIVIHDGRTLLRAAYGMADLELNVPLRPEHVFRIGSVTKQFTGVAVLLLAEEGKLALSDPITRFLPDYPTHGRTVTIEHLLSHTSGIRSYTDIPGFWQASRTDLALDSLIALFRDEPFQFEPGERWAYNNSGYVLLGAIIEKVSGMSYAEFVRSRIFGPLGMAASSYDSPARVIPNRIGGYVPHGDGWRHAEYLSMTGPYAAGALVSTVDDLARWYQASERGELLSADSWRRALSGFPLRDARDTRYGAGWGIGQLGTLSTVEHGGGINGFVSYVLSVPSQL